jgi:hypothetical protein
MAQFHAIPVTVPQETAEWFGVADKPMTLGQTPRNADLQPAIIAPYPGLHLLLVIISLLTPILWWFSGKMGISGVKHGDLHLLLFWFLLFIANMVFLIAATSIVLRYEAAWFMLAMGIPLWFADQAAYRYRIKSEQSGVLMAG